MSAATAADVLDAVLSHAEPTGSARDARIRRALSVAATAVREGREPLAAISEMYEAEQLER